MKIIEDVNNKPQKHILKNKYWSDNGIEVERYRLPVGDYILANEKVEDVISRKAKRGIDIKMMDFMGTYKVCVDTKYDIQELISDICGKDHERFRDSCILSQNNGIQMYVLVENKESQIKVGRDKYITNKYVGSLNDLLKWANPRLFLFRNGKQRFPTATRGQQLAKACITMEHKYGVKFVFCKPEESGAKVIELLTKGVTNNEEQVFPTEET